MRLSLLALMLFACTGAPKDSDTGPSTTGDADGDGFAADQDCDDGNATINPDATEVCDGVDNDCSGSIDDNAADGSTWYADGDSDGYGDEANTTTACDQPGGYVQSSGDCDDSNAAYNPGASESDCTDPNDYNCDGSVGYADADADGVAACQDCNDADATINPSATEVCDGVDNDCSGTIDDNTTDGATWYADSDSDGYGDSTVSQTACSQPAGYVADNTDCDDTNNLIFPGASETDCADPTDYNCDGSVGFVDSDGDGYSACDECNDTNAASYPGATEVCDTIDNNCDGIVDTDAVDVVTWYMDSDSDGYGVDDSVIVACDQPTGYAGASGDCNDSDTAYNPGASETDCADPNDYNCDGSTGFTDADGDGYAACDDCNDTSAAAYPGATEVCDSLDNNCDGSADEASAVDAVTWFMDADNDGYGDPTMPMVACGAPDGYVADGSDCNDADATINPGAVEVCDTIDNNCDGNADLDAATAGTWYADSDGDGYGDASVTMDACEAPAGYVSDNTDCDDTQMGAYPGASEYCDGYDNDCNGVVDEDTAVDASTWYIDADADGYGDMTMMVVQCAMPDGYVLLSGDCDDGRAESYPGADEYCNSYDDNCDGEIDEDAALDAMMWYMDGDADGYGDVTMPDVDCEAPAGYVMDSTDCDDGRAESYPGAAEYCNSYDDNCDGEIDEDAALDVMMWYMDGDADGYGDASMSDIDCEAPAGYVMDSTDCDDGRAESYPGAAEYCNSYDDNCDGEIDEDAALDVMMWYMDSDADGYGDASMSDVDCDQPDGYVMDSTDCDDGRAESYPGAAEYCNSYDDNCDGEIDEDAALDVMMWYMDSDADGYGDASMSDVDCDQPDGYVMDSTDCNDGRAESYPGATEYCNSYDDNCDGEADEDAAVDVQVWYMDGDSDGYGDVTMSDIDCDQPDGYVSDSTDCDDTAILVYPGAMESCNSIDDNCDGEVDEDTAVDVMIWYMDGDSDGYGDVTMSDIDCDQPDGYVMDNSDCDDSRAESYPGATEYCNGFDDNCSGVTDEDDAVDVAVWYRDADSDTYGNASMSDIDCDQPAGYVSNSTDCNDSTAAINPGVAELCDTANTDENCNGTADDADAGATGKTAWYRDADSDAYGVTAMSVSACDQPSGYAAVGGDCSDSTAAINPGAMELCDSANIDEDCDTLSDDADAGAVGKATWYRDADSDTYGTTTTTMSACDQPSGYVITSTDCNDGSSAINPAATEVCDSANVDENCNGTADDADAGATGETIWYRDGDSDSYGTNSNTRTLCDQPSGFVAVGGDCDDGLAGRNPGATEICDAADIDEDCDSLADDADSSVTGQMTWYTDSDGDGFGIDTSAITVCDAPSGYESRGGDCDDTDLDINPGEAEVCGDFTDNNCDETDNDTACAWQGANASTSADVLLVGVAASDSLGGGSSTDASEAAGMSFSGVGDLNGDNIDDVAMGSFQFDTTGTNNRGRTYVFYGPLSSTETLAGADAIVTGSEDGERVGATVTGCDFNGAGNNDLIVGANARNNGGVSDVGAVYVYTSLSASMLPADAAVTIYGTTTRHYVGSAIDCSADLNDDGLADLIVGGRGYDTSAAVTDVGMVGVVYGGTTGTVSLTTGADVLLTGSVTNDTVGRSLAGVMDVNGDGVDDLLVSADGYDNGSTANVGAALLYYGGSGVNELASTLTVAGADYMVLGATAGSALGSSVDSAGDMDADGYGDLVLGGANYTSGSSANVGVVYFVYGDATLSGSISGSSLSDYAVGFNANDNAGRSVAGPGDVNGDGFDDVVVGAPGGDVTLSNQGVSVLLYGPVSGAISVTSVLLGGADGAAFYGSAASQSFGRTAAAAGDVNNDGFDDFMVGSPEYDNGATTNTGAVWFFSGQGF